MYIIIYFYRTVKHYFIVLHAYGAYIGNYIPARAIILRVLIVL
jgi:hypothetical protein